MYQCDRPNNDSVILADSTTTPRTTSQTVSLPPTSAALSVTTAISTQVISGNFYSRINWLLNCEWINQLINLVIHKCVDYSSLCSFWARAGECRKNRKYMFSTCPASCNCCKDKLVLNKSGFYPFNSLLIPNYFELILECVNQHQQCKTWASAGECSSNADYMEFYCPAACKLCRTGDSPAVMMPSSRPTSKKKSTRSKRFSRFFDLIA